MRSIQKVSGLVWSWLWLNFFRTYCLSSMLYAVEVTYPSNKDIQSLDNCVNLAVIKIFKVTCDANISFNGDCKVDKFKYTY